jgi:hypothetical protein
MTRIDGFEVDESTPGGPALLDAVTSSPGMRRFVAAFGGTRATGSAKALAYGEVWNRSGGETAAVAAARAVRPTLAERLAEESAAWDALTDDERRIWDNYLHGTIRP